MDPSRNPGVFHATTIVSVRRDGRVAVAGDGQVTLGNTVMKANACKVRRLGRVGQVLAGFAGTWPSRMPSPCSSCSRPSSRSTGS